MNNTSIININELMDILKDGTSTLLESPFNISVNDFYKEEFDNLDKLIANAKKIILFRHIGADQDAIAAVASMKVLIDKKYPKKEVIISKEKQNFANLTQEDLVIIMDVGDTHRIAGSYFGEPKTARIDHHKTGMICDVTIEDVNAGSTAELLTLFYNQKDYPLDKKICELLFKGIISDTGRMQYSLSPSTIAALGILQSYQIDYKTIYTQMYSKSPASIKARKYILNNFLTTEHGVAYLFIDNKKAMEAGVNINDVTSMPYELENMEGHPIWMIAAQRKDGIYIRLRSRGIDIRELAKKYNGGGHAEACGIKLRSRKELTKLIDDCDTLLVKKNVLVEADNMNDEKEDYLVKYDQYLEEHIDNVEQAYEYLKQYCPEVLKDIDMEAMDEQIMDHDKSKYDEEEYEPYALYFNVSKEKYEKEFDVAWNHHQKCNPHHWNYWVLIQDSDEDTQLKPIEIPKNYIIEMICDWFSFAFKKNDLNALFTWYADNKDKIIMHPETKKQVIEILDIIHKTIGQTENIKEDVAWNSTWNWHPVLVGTSHSEDFEDFLRDQELYYEVHPTSDIKQYRILIHSEDKKNIIDAKVNEYNQEDATKEFPLDEAHGKSWADGGRKCPYCDEILDPGEKHDCKPKFKEVQTQNTEHKQETKKQSGHQVRNVKPGDPDNKNYTLEEPDDDRTHKNYLHESKIPTKTKQMIYKLNTEIKNKYGAAVANYVMAEVNKGNLEDLDDVQRKLQMLKVNGGIDPRTGKKIPMKSQQKTINEDGHLSKDMTVEDIAKKHNVSVEELEKQVKMGIDVEHEHTSDNEEAKRIALDHLFEIPDYYTRLKKMEEEGEKALQEDIKEWKTMTPEERESAKKNGDLFTLKGKMHTISPDGHARPIESKPVKTNLRESVLDPINKERCPEIFKDNKMISSVRKFIIDIVNDFKKQVNFDFKVKNIYMIGSSTGFQYSLTSDIDIELETSIKKSQMKDIIKIIPKGTLLPGTNKPINIFIINDGDSYDFKQAENVYDLVKDKWLKQSEKSDYHIPYQYVKDLSQFFMNGCDLTLSKFEQDKKEMEEYLSLNPKTQEISENEKAEAISRKITDLKNDIDALTMAHHVVFAFEKEGYENMPFRVRIEMEKNDDPRYSINNLVYKMVDRFGYFEKINNAKKEAIELVKKAENYGTNK